MLSEEVRLWLDTETAQGRLPQHETVEKDHGRIEIRRYALSERLEWLAPTALRDSGENAALTDAQGYYAFSELTAGSYTVQVEVTTLPIGTRLTSATGLISNQAQAYWDAAGDGTVANDLSTVDYRSVCLMDAVLKWKRWLKMSN